MDLKLCMAFECYKRCWIGSLESERKLGHRMSGASGVKIIINNLWLLIVCERNAIKVCCWDRRVA